MSIQKHRVIGALRWLIAHNLLYKNIGINHRLLETWDEQFILFSIMDTMVDCNSDQYKQQNYATNLYNGNFKNNFNATIASAGIEGDHINFGCVYSDIDNRRQNLTLQFLSTIDNVKAQVSIADPPRLDIITLCMRGQPVLLND